MSSLRIASALVVVAAGAAFFSACSPSAIEPESEAPAESAVDLANADGQSVELRVGNYNIQWFGDPDQGPSNEALQLENAAEVLRQSDVDLWVLSEIVDDAAFRDLIDALPGFSGFLANDPVVDGGASFYRESEQKVAIVYRTDKVHVDSPRVILQSYDYEFGSRPPIAADVSVERAGAAGRFTLVGLHMKAMGDTESYNRRHGAADALHDLLSTDLSGKPVMVIGDWNDDVDKSIASGKPTPFGSLLQDGDLRFLTLELSLANVGSRVVGSTFIDHQLVSQAALDHFVEGSTIRVAADQMVASYASTTSDHFPIASTFSFPVEARGLINEVLANEPGSDTSRELVEIANASCSPLDVSDYTLEVDGEEVFRFPQGTAIGGGGLAVVFGRASAVPSGLALAFGASGLGLLNSKGHLALVDANGDVASEVGWSSSKDGVSLTRVVDGDPTSSFKEHPTRQGKRFSPGRTVGGATTIGECAPNG